MKNYSLKCLLFVHLVGLSFYSLKTQVKETPLFNENLLKGLLNDFKKYKTTNVSFHSGDLYEHSVWNALAVQKWWDEKNFWVEGIDPKYKDFTIYAALLHDIGKGGDLEYTYYDKKDHPVKGFDYLTYQVPYKLSRQGSTFDFKKFFQGNEHYRKMLAILIGMHWDFGYILKEMDKKDEQELLENYFKLMQDYVNKVNYNNGKIDEQLVRISILISAADIKGSEFIPNSDNILGLSSPPAPHPVKTPRYEKFKLDTKGKELRDDILSYFKELERQSTIAKPKTQTEALLSIPYIRFLVNKLYGKTVERNKAIIKQIMARELHYASTDFVFYHGASIGQFVLFEVIKSFYKLFYPTTGIADESFQALRTPYAKIFDEFKTIRDFTENQINYFTEIHDTPSAKEIELIEHLTGKKVKNLSEKEYKKAQKELQGKIDWTVPAHLLSVNLSLYGNIGKKTLSECTFDYFAADKRRKGAASLAAIYKSIFKEFGIDEVFIPKFENLADTITTDVGVIYQIFIPKNKVNDIVYLARDYGKSYGSPLALGYLFNRNIPKEERLPQFWDLLDNDPEALFAKPKSIADTLTQYITNPTSIPNVNRLQARILMNNDLLLNPSSGVKIFVYTTLAPERLGQFKQDLDMLTRDAFRQFLKKNVSQQQVARKNPTH